ncbi:hypothetical protein AB1Y20_009520 [Prymnesium parvum]|uniref:Uncharacterized protein n=1 Tax=Prymnesium parvum TaxID=97485 RepID=A0AB34K6Q8_PRYPA
MAFVSISLKVVPRKGRADKEVMKATVMQVQDEWTFEEVLCEMLKCEGLPLRSEFVVLTVCHSQRRCSGFVTAWKRLAEDAREIHFEIQLSEADSATGMDVSSSAQSVPVRDAFSVLQAGSQRMSASARSAANEEALSAVKS